MSELLRQIRVASRAVRPVSPPAACNCASALGPRTARGAPVSDAFPANEQGSPFPAADQSGRARITAKGVKTMSAGTETVHMSASQAAAILQNFVVGGRLKTIPARRLKKLVVFAWLSERFTLGAVYSESAVGELLRAAHDDVATLRRGMYDEYFLDRRDGAYWRTPERQKFTIVDGDP